MEYSFKIRNDRLNLVSQFTFTGDEKAANRLAHKYATRWHKPTEAHCVDEFRVLARVEAPPEPVTLGCWVGMPYSQVIVLAKLGSDPRFVENRYAVVDGSTALIRAIPFDHEKATQYDKEHWITQHADSHSEAVGWAEDSLRWMGHTLKEVGNDGN